ncbi:MAG: hypothetical protein ACYS1A_18545 [Planctomycetota bacterium]|jgi:hypothetical protein
MLKEPYPLPVMEGVTAENFNDALEKNLDAVAKDPDLVKMMQRDRVGNPQMLGPRVAPAEQWVDDMVSAAQAKSQKWLDNSLRPKKSPKERAIAAKTKYKNNMQKALNEGTWDKGIAGYDEVLRNETIAAVGTSGFSQGVANKKAKAVAKIKKMQPMVAALATTLDAMPQDTHEQRGAKMLAARDGMLSIKKKLREGG